MAAYILNATLIWLICYDKFSVHKNCLQTSQQESLYKTAQSTEPVPESVQAWHDHTATTALIIFLMKVLPSSNLCCSHNSDNAQTQLLAGFFTGCQRLNPSTYTYKMFKSCCYWIHLTRSCSRIKALGRICFITAMAKCQDQGVREHGIRLFNSFLIHQALICIV